MIVKGFIEIQNLISNSPAVVSTIGELSDLSRTYSLNKAEYSSNNAEGFKLITISSVDDNGTEKELPNDLSDLVLRVSKSIYTYCSLKTRPYDDYTFVDVITNEYPTEFRNFKKGTFVDGIGLALPQWISFDIPSSNSKIKIWFSDTAFAAQYDSYVIKPVIPLDNPDVFFSPPNDVKKLVLASSLQTLLDKANELKAGEPETAMRSITVNYSHPSLGAGGFPVGFVVLVYGRQGDNIDVIKDTIIEYLVTNSTRTRQEWEVIFPELFKRTEFVVIPDWDKYSIPNLLLKSGVYSSLMNPIEILSRMVSKITFYPEQHVRANITVTTFPYRCISLAIVNGPGNDGVNTRFDTKYSDFIPEQPSSLDFNRMSIQTQEMFLMLNEMLILADTYTTGTIFPKKYRTVWRDSKMYISRVLDNVQFLVLVRLSNG